MFTFSIIVVFAMVAIPLMSADGIVGKWKRNDGASVVEFKCDGDNCRMIVVEANKANANVCNTGKNIIGYQTGSVKKTGDNVWQGTLFNPEDCKTYSARATVSGNTLTLKGGYKIFGAYIGKTMTFKRQ